MGVWVSRELTQSTNWLVGPLCGGLDPFGRGLAKGARAPFDRSIDRSIQPDHSPHVPFPCPSQDGHAPTAPTAGPTDRPTDRSRLHWTTDPSTPPCSNRQADQSIDRSGAGYLQRASLGAGATKAEARPRVARRSAALFMILDGKGSRSCVWVWVCGLDGVSAVCVDPTKGCPLSIAPTLKSERQAAASTASFRPAAPGGHQPIQRASLWIQRQALEVAPRSPSEPKGLGGGGVGIHGGMRARD